MARPWSPGTLPLQDQEVETDTRNTDVCMICRWLVAAQHEQILGYGVLPSVSRSEKRNE